MAPKKGKKAKEVAKEVKAVEELIDPSVLENPEGSDCVVLPMDKDDLDSYYRFVHGMIRASTGLERIKRFKRIGDIPMTLGNANPKSFVVRALGTFQKKKFDNLLMIVRGSLYFLALRRKPVERGKNYPGEDQWYEVKASSSKIRDARPLYFDASYNKFPPEEQQLGFMHLKRAIFNLVFRKPEAKDFVVVAVNLCEPVRSKFIACRISRTLTTAETRDVCEICRFLIKNWGTISRIIEEYQKEGEWNPRDGITFPKKLVLKCIWVIKKVLKTE